jgi:hypothetical protein
MKKIIAIALGAAALALCSPGTAQADATDVADMEYLTKLNERFYVTADSSASAIRWGHAACNALDEGNSFVSVGRSVSVMSGWSDVNSGFLVGAATRTYCPWNMRKLNRELTALR